MYIVKHVHIVCQEINTHVIVTIIDQKFVRTSSNVVMYMIVPVCSTVLLCTQ